jgi:hypothetical protein
MFSVLPLGVSAAGEREHRISIVTNMLACGTAISNRQSAAPGEMVILAALGRDLELNGKPYRAEFRGWYSPSGIPVLTVKKTMGIFFMPDHDVDIVPLFRLVENPDKVDWQQVRHEIAALDEGKSLTVDLRKETAIPDETLRAMAGKDATVRFVSTDLAYSISGKDIALTEDVKGGYSLTCADHTLADKVAEQFGDDLLDTFEVKVETPHTVTSELEYRLASPTDPLYLYRLIDGTPTFTYVAKNEDGIIRLPITESGIWIVAAHPLDVEVVA